MKGLTQGSPYFGKVFVVDSQTGTGQVRVKVEGVENTVMIMPAAYLEPAVGAAVDLTAAHGQAVGHTPQWLAQEARAEDAAEAQPAADALGNVLQAGDLVRLKGRSQYDGQVFTVESTDVGDGRVRVSLQLSETAVSRMAFDPAHLELVTVDEQGVPQEASPQAAPQAAEQEAQTMQVVQGAPQVVQVPQQQFVEYAAQTQPGMLMQGQPPAGMLIQGQPPVMQGGYMVQPAA